MRNTAILAPSGIWSWSSWSRSARNRLTILLVALGPCLAVATSVVLGDAGENRSELELVRGVFLLDLIYVIVAAGLIVWRVATLIAARRAKSAGSRLHLRLTGVFTLIALAPTIMVAVFATLTLNFGIESWFSNQVGSVVRNALETAQAYEREHKRGIRGDILLMANDINRDAATGINLGVLGELLRNQQRVREIPEAYIFNSKKEILARGEFSYLFRFDPPSDEELFRARSGEVVITEDNQNDEIRATVALPALFDAFLMVSRRVDGQVLQLLDDTRETVALYERLERERGGILFEFAILYVGFALIVILAAIWLGLWFAERLARPVGQLAGAAQRVGAGDLEARVIEEPGDDEIAVLSRVFNRMTEQVKGQHDALIAANRESERRRQFIEAVLSGVTAGVIRLGEDGRIELINEAGSEHLGVDAEAVLGAPLEQAAPMFAPLLEKARTAAGGGAQDRVHATVAGRDRDLLARITRSQGGAGYVLTFDDLTELVSAQRMAAWGDVARRIAHEIKNPLTPIQLSAERLKRKFSGKVGEDRASFEQYSDVIVRQARDIRRMVDEFSQFARMPAPRLRTEDMREVLADAVLLQRSAGNGVVYRLDTPDAPAPARCDRGLIAQALTNLLKNAAEAIEQRVEAEGEQAAPGEIRAALTVADGRVAISIADNGIGLPEGARSRLTEPYVTTREKGTGLGLAIVKKIVEDHDGVLKLSDAPAFSEGASTGALVEISLPLARTGAGEGGDDRGDDSEDGAADATGQDQ